MKLPETLPARIYLLACDVERHRVRGQDIGLVVRGALLADLNMRGCLVEENGSVRSASSRRTGDPVLDDELRALGEHGPRSWRASLRGGKATLAAVRDQLAAQQLISVERTRKLGIFPATRVRLTDPAQVAALRESVRAAVFGTGPVSAVSTEDATLVALVAVGELGTVLSGKDRRTYQARIEEFTERGGSAVPALRKVLRQIKSARTAAYASGG
ncbi:MAG TPA: GPP34 family phosphoprotein [Pseudonocardiaceae bacterium]|nr:GPP34 family phosphoprotein [Pseudonocardiaceae bacterium]